MTPTAREHDLCLAACERIRQQIQHGERTSQDADADLVALSVVAGAYACSEPVSRKFWMRAQEIAGF